MNTIKFIVIVSMVLLGTDLIYQKESRINKRKYKIKMTRHNKDKCKRYNCQECYKERLKELE